MKIFWLDRKAAIDRLRTCAEGILARYPEVESVGLFGSLAEGTGTPRSDADVLIVLRAKPGEPFQQRISPYQLEFSGVGIAVDLFCYTPEEIRTHAFAAHAARTALWLATRQLFSDEGGSAAGI